MEREQKLLQACQAHAVEICGDIDMDRKIIGAMFRNVRLVRVLR